MPPRPSDEAAMVDTTAALASLYQAPLAEFVGRRRSVVSRLKKSGHKDVAARLETAAKPSRAAHLVNQVFWRARDAYDALLEAGTAARAAQQARLLGDGAADLPHTMRLRDEAVRAAVQRALAIAADEGLGRGDALTSQVRASFEALAAHGQEGRLPHGLLVDDVPLPGLEALAGLVLPADSPPARRFEIVARHAPRADEAAPAPDPRRATAEARLADARERAELAEERLSELDRALDAAARVLVEAEHDLEAARARVAVASQSVESGRTTRDAAARETEARRAAVVQAEQGLAELAGPPHDGPPLPPAPRRRR